MLFEQKKKVAWKQHFIIATLSDYFRWKTSNIVQYRKFGHGNEIIIFTGSKVLEFCQETFQKDP